MGGKHTHEVRYLPAPADSAALLQAQKEAAEAKKKLDVVDEERKKAEVALEQAKADHTTTQKELTKMEKAAADARSKLEELTREENERRRKLAERVAREAARLREIGMDNVGQYNFAVCGSTGVGKSSFCNIMRGILDKKHPKFAKVGTGEQTTTETTKYPHPDAPHIVFWDVPGGGCDDFPSATYFEDQCLDLFDGLLLLYNGRFTEVRSWRASPAWRGWAGDLRLWYLLSRPRRSCPSLFARLSSTSARSSSSTQRQIAR